MAKLFVVFKVVAGPVFLFCCLVSGRVGALIQSVSSCCSMGGSSSIGVLVVSSLVSSGFCGAACVAVRLVVSVGGVGSEF